MRQTIPTLLVSLLACSATAQAQRGAQAPQPTTPIAGPGPGQSAGGPAAPPGPGQMPAGAIQIRALVDQVSADLGREFIIDPRVAGVWGQTTNTDPDYETLLGILRTNNLIAVETADQILILPEQNARSMPTRILQDDDRRVSDHEIVTRIIDLPAFPVASSAEPTDPDAANPFANVPATSATQLVPILRPMLPQTAQLGAVPNTNSLIIVDRYDNVRRITAVIDQIIDSLDD